MAAYKVAIIQVKKADVLALTSTTAISKNIGTITGETVASITGVSMIDLDGVNMGIAVTYSV